MHQFLAEQTGIHGRKHLGDHPATIAGVGGQHIEFRHDFKGEFPLIQAGADI